MAGFIYVFRKHFYYLQLMFVKFSIFMKKYVFVYVFHEKICLKVRWLCSELARIIHDYSAGFTGFNDSVWSRRYPEAIVGQPDSANDSRLRASTLRHARLLTLSPKSDIADIWISLVSRPLRSHVHLHSVTFYRRIPFATSRSRTCLTNRKKHFSRLASFRFPKYPWLDLKQVLSDKIRKFLCGTCIYVCPILRI